MSRSTFNQGHTFWQQPMERMWKKGAFVLACLPSLSLTSPFLHRHYNLLLQDLGMCWRPEETSSFVDRMTPGFLDLLLIAIVRLAGPQPINHYNGVSWGCRDGWAVKSTSPLHRIQALFPLFTLCGSQPPPKILVPGALNSVETCTPVVYINSAGTHTYA